ncbi:MULTISPECIES: tetratricopeptide repeat protein [Streptomyces]|uniref:tetratricopeptide repeat protein n=1 Tax=Streptomyces TaxID=1883 RepID=UPI000B9E6F1B|nr:tetratricopeptide repeat protein [Streptomyces kasugaensis]
MVDPISIGAVTAVLGTVTMSMANEAGKRAWESAGVLVRRIAGRETPAPDGSEARAALAGLLVEGAQRDPAHARALAAWLNGAPRPGGADAVPRQLPVSVRFFTDRQDPLKRLDREAGRPADGRPRLALVHGPDGIGTSALAVHWGNAHLARFPDGQLYADLRGPAPDGALDQATVLRLFLRQLGFPDGEIPPAAEDRADLYRTSVADRRLLVVLDHAQSAAQVLPLLTSAAGVFTIVVARRPLSGLDAVPVPVGPLPEKYARDLLGQLTGEETLAAARAALPEVLARCAGSPFALRAAAVRLAEPARPHQEPPVRDDDPVHTAAEDAYQDLAPDAARLYRLLALRPWPAIGPGLAAATAQLTAPRAAALLAELAAHRLLETTATGHYRYRPSVRRHAETAAAREDGIAGCTAAVTRAVAASLRFAVRADRAVLPQRWHLGPLYATLEPGPYADQGEALAALTGELGRLLEAVRAAEEFADPDSVCQLCEALWAVQLKAGRHDELLPALRAGVRAADALEAAAHATVGAPAPGPAADGLAARSRMAGRMHTQLALALTEVRHYEEAESELRAAAEAERRAGHLRGRATAVETLGLLRLRQWRYQEAYDHFDEAAALLAGIPEDGEGAADLPRARALLERHRGRALRGLLDWDDARERLGRALRFFRDSAEPYNTARTLTDLAETHLDAGDPAAALPLIDEAAALLQEEGAAFPLGLLRALRERCVAETE